MRIIQKFALALLILNPGIAQMTQEDFESIPHHIHLSVASAETIVVARRLHTQRVLREVVFPRETHFSKSEETIYREFVAQYELVEILKAHDSISLTVGQMLEVFYTPVYDEYLIRLHHEKGITKSPMVLEYTPIAPPDGDTVILFLMRHGMVFRPTSDAPEEGLKGLDVVNQLIVAQNNPALWYLEDRSAFHLDGEAVIIGENGIVFSHTIRRDAKGRLQERICQQQFSQENLTAIRNLITETSWSRITFEGTLLPDETLPTLYIGLNRNEAHSILSVQCLETQRKYQTVMSLVSDICDTSPWVTKRPEEINFKLWPLSVKEIHLSGY